MYRLFAACLIATAAIGLLQPVSAQDSTQQPAEALPPLTPEHLELAAQVFAASNMGRTFDEILPTVADRAKTTFIKNNPQMQLGIIEAVDRVALDMVKNRKDLDQALSRIWARAFEPQDLNMILQFYQSPTGQKFAENQSRIMSTQLAIADNWTQELANEMAARVRKELQKMARSDAQQLRGSNTNPQN